MTTKLILMTVLAAFFGSQSYAQTADEYISQGRAQLAATNIVGANNCFSNAVVLAPNDATANVLYAATRLLAFPYDASGSAFLDRIGMSAGGRDIYNWTATMPQDTNGVIQFPEGVNAYEIAAMLRTNLLGRILAAEGNLAKVTDPGFLLTLSSNETRSVAVTLDRGDVLLLRAMLKSAEYFILNTHAWNVDVQLTTIMSLRDNEQSTFANLLKTHPQLLEFYTTNDLAAAQAAFTTAANRYFEASQFIRNRSGTETRLFNLDLQGQEDEQRFRSTLSDLTNSLLAVTTLSSATNCAVDLRKHFDGKHALRSFLPHIVGNGFFLDSAPDITFGGIVYGLEATQVDEAFAEVLTPIPTIRQTFSAAGGAFQFPVNLLADRGYSIEVSSNLVDWVVYDSFFASDPRILISDPIVLSQAGRFYRVVDRTEEMPTPRNDAFANSTLIPAMNEVLKGYNSSATVETNEVPSGMGHTVWFTWTAQVSGDVAVVVNGKGSWLIDAFTGNSISSLARVAGPGYGELVLNATAGTTYHFSVDSSMRDGAFTILLTRMPQLLVTNPSQDAIFKAPATVRVSGTANDPDGYIDETRIVAWPSLEYTTTNTSFDFNWTNVMQGDYYVEFTTRDNQGAAAFQSRHIRVSPPNDNFADATPIAGAPLGIMVSNLGSSKEAGEPNHCDAQGWRSLWWNWQATTNGPVTIVCQITNQNDEVQPILAAYTGTTLATLSVVASNTPASGNTAIISFSATAGTTYHIVVDSYDTGNVGLGFFPTLAPTVQITAPAAYSTFLTPTNINITAQASDVDGSIARVDFYLNGQLLGSKSSPPYSITWTNASARDYWHEIVAVAFDNIGAPRVSDPISILVQSPPPPNDNFNNRTTLVGSIIVTGGSNVAATRESFEPFHWSTTGGKSVWWTWQAPLNGTVEISTTGSNFDTILAAYTGSTLTDLVSMGKNDDSFDGSGASRVLFPVTAGTFYHIAVDGYSGQTGEITLNIELQ